MRQTDELPPYVVAGEWRDPEWIALSQDAARPKSREELQRLIAGPRRHPYGAEAHQVMVGGEVWIFPDKRRADEAMT